MELPELIQPDWQISNNVKVFTTTRGKNRLGVYGFNTANHVNDDKNIVEQARKTLTNKIGKPINWLNQVHGDDISTTFSPEQNFDGAITNSKNYALAIQTADCLPIVLADKYGTEVAILHCGWRGLAKGIIQNCLNQMHTPKPNLAVWFAPCISLANYEVSIEVWDAITNKDIDYAKSFYPSPYKLEHFQLDLVQLAKIQLEKLGVNDFYYSNLCTFNDARLYSYRRNKNTGRIATLAYLE